MKKSKNKKLRKSQNVVCLNGMTMTEICPNDNDKMQEAFESGFLVLISESDLKRLKFR